MAEGVAQRADSASEARLRRPSRQTGKGVGGREKVPRVHCESLERHSGWMWRLQLKQWYESREALGKQLAKLKIGQYGLRPFGSNQKQIHSRNQSMGCRITKSNVETYQSGVISTLKSFLEFRRMHGLTVYGVVLRDRYMQLLRAEVVKTKCMLLELRDKSKMVSGQVELQECESLVLSAEKVHKLLVKRIGVMESSVEKQKRSYWTSVMAWIGASALRTQRVTRLTPVQVCQRVELTWQSHDYAQWIAVQGSDEQLAEHIRSPIQWRSGLKSTVWFSSTTRQSGWQAQWTSDPSMRSSRQPVAKPGRSGVGRGGMQKLGQLRKFSPSRRQCQSYHSPEQQCRSPLCRPSVQAVVRLKKLV